MKTIFKLMFCCYVATFLLPARSATVTVTIINNGGTAYGVQPIWSSTTTPNIGQSFGGGLVTNVPGTENTSGAIGWEGPSFGGLGSSPKVSLYYYSNYTHYITADTSKRTIATLNATYTGTGPVVLSYTPPGGSDPTTNLCNITICARNNDVVYHLYSLWKNGVESNSEGYPGGFGIAAGAVGCYTFQVACTNSTGWSMNYASTEVGYTTQDPATNYTTMTNTAAVQPPSTNLFTPTDPSTYVAGGVRGSNILFTSSASTNTIISQQQGDSAIKEAIDLAAAGTIKAIGEVKGAIDGLGTNSDGFYDSGITNAVDRFRQENTNLLTQILTNAQQTIDLDASGTNLTAATSAAGAITGDASDGIDDITGLVGSAWGGSLAEAGSPDVFQFAFAGQTINLDPEVQLPGTMGVAKVLMSAAVLLLYAYSVAKMYYEIMRTMSTAQIGKVPELSIFGTNIAGAAALPIVAAIFLGLWVIVFTTMSAAIFGVLGDNGWSSAMSAAASVTLPAGTKYLLFSSTPVQLIISLMFSRIILWLTAAKTVLVAASISRFLVG